MKKIIVTLLVTALAAQPVHATKTSTAQPVHATKTSTAYRPCCSANSCCQNQHCAQPVQAEKTRISKKEILARAADVIVLSAGVIYLSVNAFWFLWYCRDPDAACLFILLAKEI